MNYCFSKVNDAVYQHLQLISNLLLLNRINPCWLFPTSKLAFGHNFERALYKKSNNLNKIDKKQNYEKYPKRLHPIRSISKTLLILTASSAMGSPAVDFPLASANCPGGNGGGVAYLSQYVQPDKKTNQCNVTDVQNLIFSLGQGGTLIVDQTCVLSSGLRIPSRFVLKGLGLGNKGILTFTHDGIAISNCPELPHTNITLSDLDLYGSNPGGNSKVIAPHSIGIALNNEHTVSINNVRVSNFMTGIYGESSFYVWINDSNISNNRGDNIRIGYNANSWRIRDGIISQAGAWGINVLGPGDDAPIETVENGLPITIDGSNDLLIDGAAMESNRRGAVRTNTYGSRITNARLEFNGVENSDFPNTGIMVDQNAIGTRLLTNLLSSDCIADFGSGTQRAFNIPAIHDEQVCTKKTLGLTQF